MKLTRRNFLKTSVASAVVASAGISAGSKSAFAANPDKPYKLENTEEVTNICGYCSGGCGLICSVRDGELVHVEGDPDHVINEGGLCAKGAGIYGLRSIVDEKTGEKIYNPNHITKPLVRRPGKTEWEELSWEQAIDEIAQHVKKTRDESFETTSNGVTVNRTLAIGSIGGSQQNLEEDYLILKLMRSLGIVAIDNQARV